LPRRLHLSDTHTTPPVYTVTRHVYSRFTTTTFHGWSHRFHTTLHGSPVTSCLLPHSPFTHHAGCRCRLRVVRCYVLIWILPHTVPLLHALPPIWFVTHTFIYLAFLCCPTLARCIFVARYLRYATTLHPLLHYRVATLLRVVGAGTITHRFRFTFGVVVAALPFIYSRSSPLLVVVRLRCYAAPLAVLRYHVATLPFTFTHHVPRYLCLFRCSRCYVPLRLLHIATFYARIR